MEGFLSSSFSVSGFAEGLCSVSSCVAAVFVSQVRQRRARPQKRLEPDVYTPRFPAPLVRLASWPNQVKYGPEEDRTHMDVTTLADVYQWMQVRAFLLLDGVWGYSSHNPPYRYVLPPLPLVALIEATDRTLTECNRQVDTTSKDTAKAIINHFRGGLAEFIGRGLGFWRS